MIILTDREVRRLALRRGLCLRCAENPQWSRRLCRACYGNESAHGHLHRWKRELPWRAADDVLDDWRLIAATAPKGTTLAELAARIGVSFEALRRTLQRARARGDRRAIYHSDHAREQAREQARRSSETGR